MGLDEKSRACSETENWISDFPKTAAAGIASQPTVMNCPDFENYKFKECQSILMADNEKKKDKFEDSTWKDLIKKVKQENKTAGIESIEESPTKEILDVPKPIEKPSIDNVPIENPLEEPAVEEKMPAPQRTARKPRKSSGKFTTIMITKDLKQKLASQKELKESFGDLLERLLKKQTV